MGGGACHEALQHDAHLSEAKVWRSRTRGAGVLRARRNTRHSIRATSATAFIGTTAAAAAFFYRVRAPPASGVLLQNSIAARGPGYAGATSWPLPAPVSAPWAKSRRQVKSWFRATPWRRATKRTNHARLERLLDDPDFLRRCPAPTALNRRENPNSIRRIGHRHGCMPLAKWETGSGRFGGCLIKIAKPGRSRPGIQATSPIFDPLGVARLPLFGNFSYSAFFAPC